MGAGLLAVESGFILFNGIYPILHNEVLREKKERDKSESRER
jgi:hypothetical protein